MFRCVKDQIWFFNCKWAPDPRAGRVLYDLPIEMPDAEVISEMWKRNGATEDDPRPQLKTCLCRVVAISALMRKVLPPGSATEDEKVRLRLLWLPRDVNDMEQSSEGSILTAFLGAIGKYKPQLVDFNTKTSEIRALLQRAYACGISVPEFCHRPEKPWDGADYFARDNDYNIDLMDVLNGYSSKCPPLLEELAVIAGIPGKIKGWDDDITDMWLGGKWDEVVQANCFSAITTYLVWLRAAHLAGFVNDDDYDCEQMVLSNYLLDEAEKPEMQFLNNYIDEWNRLQDIIQ